VLETFHVKTLREAVEVIKGNRLPSSRQRSQLSRRANSRLRALGLLLAGSDAMRSIRVLAIEDSDVHVHLIRGMLASAKGAAFAVEVFHCLSAGLERLVDGGIDVILLDLTLPDCQGIESCRRVASEAPALPIVVLTGVDDEEMAIRALKCGAQDYLVKGQIDNQLLSRSLRYAIERKRGELEVQRARDELEMRVEERTAELRRMQEAARQQQEELAHVSRLNMLGEMASGLAHELNQPLMAIIGFTDTCLQMHRASQFESDSCAQILEYTAAEAKRAGEIIKRLRKLVSRRSGQVSLVDLNNLIRETVPLFGRGSAIEFSLDLDENSPQVMADRIQIQQVLLNLAHNAIQAMDSADKATKRLAIKTGIDNSNENTFVEVSDTGPGLPAEDLNRVFEPFFTRKADGLGLGLSISRSIVEAHAGKMTVRQNPEAGLTFRFVLPLKTTDDPVSG